MKKQRLGFVSFAGGMALAELLGRDRWRVTIAGRDEPSWARAIAERYRDEYRGPSDGDYAVFILDALARTVHGVAAYDRAPLPIDAVS